MTLTIETILSFEEVRGLVVFRDEAQALEERLLGASVSTGSHTDLTEHQPTEGDAVSLGAAESALSDAV